MVKNRKSCKFRLPELLKVLTLNGGMEPKEASKLLDELIQKHDKNHDGKFNFEGKKNAT